MTEWVSLDVQDWEKLGTYRQLAGHRIFSVDLPAAGAEQHEPLLVIHGYPTSSFDFQAVAAGLSASRRVVLMDLLGYGFSDKPDIHYTMALQADVVAAVVAALDLERFALLTHDMGDTVGGELLSRHMEGTWPVEITRRIVTNGSIYIQMAHLSAGQEFLLALPDEVLAEDSAPNADAVSRSLVATLAPRHKGIDMSAHGEIVSHSGGNRMLARTIRYIEERRTNERRFTGAIETHPSPLTVVWGPEDPIAVAPMAEHLKATRPDADLCWLDGCGHYPQIEDPQAYLNAIERGL